MFASTQRRIVFLGFWSVVSFSLNGFALAWAGSPQVRFDMPYMLEARDVTPEEFAATHPNERLREVRFPISTFLSAGDPRELTQLLYQIEGPQAVFEVADFLPKTTLDTRYAGPIHNENSRERGGEFKIDIGGNYQWFGTPTVGGRIYDKATSSVKVDLLPPLEALNSSGTTQRQRGVYFRLHNTPQTWLEGEREFAVVLRVPEQWRGDYVVVRCQAAAVRKGIVSAFDEKISAGRRDFVVALHATGDRDARAQAASFVRAESQLRREAYQRQATIEHASQSTLARWGIELPGDKPRIPDDWLPRLITTNATTDAIPGRLPSEVKQAARDFIIARQGMAELALGKIDQEALATR